MSLSSTGAKKSGGRPAGFRLPQAGRERREGPVAERELAELRVRDLLGLVTPADLAALPEGPVLRTEHRVLAVLLRKLRLLRRWSLRQLAAACGTSHQELAKLESARHGATAEMWFRLCGALGVPFSRLSECAEVCAAAGW